MDALARIIAAAMPEIEDRGRFDLDTAFARQCVRDEIRDLEEARRHLTMAFDLLPRGHKDLFDAVEDAISDIEHRRDELQRRVDIAVERCQGGAR